MDFTSRDQYRHVVEELARNSSASEEDVAHRAIALARASEAQNGENERQRHAGYYLVGKGRVQLEHEVGLRLSSGLLLTRIGRSLPTTMYVLGVLLVTGLASIGVLALAKRAGVPGWGLAALLAPTLVATSRFAMTMVNWLATLILPPHRLPRMNYEEGIPAQSRTLVVVPSMLTSIETVDELVDHLEVYYLANRDPHLHFALLTDFADSPEEETPGDEELLARAADGVRLLIEKYAEERNDIFFLFHRPRKWNQQEGVWMGWERKRGKLEELNALLRGRGRDAFSTIVGEMGPGTMPVHAAESGEKLGRGFGDSASSVKDSAKSGVLSCVRYVITLDADTQLPRDTARDLVATLAHPLNKPYFDPNAGRITEGYAILQPRVATTLVSSVRSNFARLFSGEAGVDPYTQMVSDVYQDAFGEGSFIGKGIYDVDAFEKACSGRFPDNRILSHDLLESSYARSGLVSDVTLMEHFPADYAADVARRHRWIRGDWQIAPWVLSRVPAASGRREKNCVSPLSRWKLLDNLRRSLVPAALLVLLLAGLVFDLGWGYCLSLLSILFAAPILQSLTQLVRLLPDMPVSLHLERTGVDFARDLARRVL